MAAAALIALSAASAAAVVAAGTASARGWAGTEPAQPAPLGKWERTRSGSVGWLIDREVEHDHSCSWQGALVGVVAALRAGR